MSSKIDEQTIVLLDSASGNAKYELGLGKIPLDPTQTNELDDPDAFFGLFHKN